MARCKECGGELVRKIGKSGNPVLVCPDCRIVYKIHPKEEEEEERPAPKPKIRRCKECGAILEKKIGKSGNPILVCPECRKVYKLNPENEEKPIEKPVEQHAPAKKCKECGTVLEKRKTKTGEIALYCPECGKMYRLNQTPAVKQPEKEEDGDDSARDSYFDGGLLQKIGWRLLGGLVTLLTLGICYPWAVCMIYNWETKHIVIEGKRLAFDGKAIQLFGKWIAWFFLTLITLGIYGLWLTIKLKKWITKHTYFAEE